MTENYRKIKVYVRENSWIALLAAKKLKVKKVAIVVGRTIHLYNTTYSQFISNKNWVSHELKHVAQYEQLGTLSFIYKYLIESIRNGYYNNKLEVEARMAENDWKLLEKYELVSYKKTN